MTKDAEKKMHLFRRLTTSLIRGKKKKEALLILVYFYRLIPSKEFSQPEADGPSTRRVPGDGDLLHRGCGAAGGMRGGPGRSRMGGHREPAEARDGSGCDRRLASQQAMQWVVAGGIPPAAPCRSLDHLLFMQELFKIKLGPCHGCLSVTARGR